MEWIRGTAALSHLVCGLALALRRPCAFSLSTIFCCWLQLFGAGPIAVSWCVVSVWKPRTILQWNVRWHRTRANSYINFNYYLRFCWCLFTAHLQRNLNWTTLGAVMLGRALPANADSIRETVSEKQKVFSRLSTDTESAKMCENWKVWRVKRTKWIV